MLGRFVPRHDEATARADGAVATRVAKFDPLNKSWWARRDLNPGPRDYESPALTAELRALELI